MQADTKQQEAIMLYLLGQARPEEVFSVEERLVVDKQFYEDLLIAEDELIDQYLGGELSDAERESFENHFLVMPERQQKVRFGRALNKYVNIPGLLPDEDPVAEDVPEVIPVVPEPPPKPWYSIFLPSQHPALSYSLAVVLVLIVATAGWFALRNLRSPTPQDPGKILTVALTPGLTRGEGEGIKKITLPPDVGTLELRLQLTRDDYVSYRATLVRDGQTEVWNRDRLSLLNDESTKSVSADIPARFLTAGDYQVRLMGQTASGSFEDVASYRFLIPR